MIPAADPVVAGLDPGIAVPDSVVAGPEPVVASLGPGVVGLTPEVVDLAPGVVGLTPEVVDLAPGVVGLTPEVVGLDPRVGFAFLAGMATFFAPCAYPLLPGYVAFFVGSEDDEPRPVAGRLLRGAGVAVATSLGFFAVYAALAGTAAAVGTRALRNVSALELVVGVLLIGLGAGMATGRLKASTLHVRLPERRRSVSGYFLFGVVYAAAAAGCTAPVFIGVATFALSSDPATALTVFAAYAGGMSLLMIGVTLLASVGRQALLRPLSGRTDLVTRLAGVALVLAGLWQIYFFVVEFRGLETLGIV